MEHILLLYGRKEMPKSIYIVEDEAIVALELKREILKLGYYFSGMSSNYTDALEGIKKSSPDLILMDITLKYSKSGIEIAKTLQETSQIPIVYLTSITDESTMKEAIITNPCGYLLKPFRRAELHSCILLALNQPSQDTIHAKTVISLGDGYVYDLEEKLLFYNDVHVSLGKKERKLLDILINAKGDIVSFNLLESLIWEGNAVAPSAFRTLLWRINRKLKHKPIESIPSYGCRILLVDT